MEPPPPRWYPEPGLWQEKAQLNAAAEPVALGDKKSQQGA